MPPPPGRTRSDAMKDNILKESTAGWANNITPLRIAKRDPIDPSSPSPSGGATKAIARRSSNSYKHMFKNNLVSNSPFKSQIPTPARSSPRNFGGRGGGEGGGGKGGGGPSASRKVSGEKRPRPDSLVAQAERENDDRIRELGYRRRQSKAYLGLREKEPVSKSPFRRIVSPNNVDDDDDSDDQTRPIAIDLPMKHPNDGATSPETTETESSLNSRDNVYLPPPAARPVTPERSLTPPNFPVQQHLSTPPNVDRRSPNPSALQPSPGRSSLVQKQRLIGPRSRSLSTGSPADTPTRERRKTVTFDERCDVLEFDRESHEDAVFETDDEEVYGAPEPQQGAAADSSPDSSNASAEFTTPTHENFDVGVNGNPSVGDDSISGLVDSMLQEQSTFRGEPSTPETHSISFTAIAHDLDMMAGGDEAGVPHGRMHHSERARLHQHEMDMRLDAQPPLSSVFTNASEPQDMAEDEPSFSSISLSTPPKPAHALPQTPRAHTAQHTYGQTPLPPLPHDTECTEDGMPLGRTHHAERARAAHQGRDDVDVEHDVGMLPPSPSPMKKLASSEQLPRELSDSLVPKLELGFRTGSPGNTSFERSFATDDVFTTPNEKLDVFASLEFEHADIDEDVLSCTSIASFHEFPPQPSFEARIEEEDEHQMHRKKRDVERGRTERRSRELSFGHSDISLDASVVSIVNDLKAPHEQKGDDPINAAENSTDELEPDCARTQAHTKDSHNDHAKEDPIARFPSPVHTQSLNKSIPHLQSRDSLYASAEGGESQASLTGNRSPRSNREDAIRRPDRQRSKDDFSSLGTLALSPAVSPMTRVEENGMEADVEVEMASPLHPQSPPQSPPSQSQRQPLKERLKRAFSPPLIAPAPIRPPLTSSASPTPASPAPASPSAASLGLTNSISASASGTHIHAPQPQSSSMFSRPELHDRAHTVDFDDEFPPVPPPPLASTPLSATFDFSQPGVDIAEMDMRSALDRLVDDVSIAGGGERVNTSAQGDRSGATTSDGDISMAETELITEESTELLANLRGSLRAKPSTVPVPQRAGAAPSPARPETQPPFLSPQSRTVSSASIVPPPPPPKSPGKSARQAREEMIKEKRKQARARDSGEYFVPPRRDAAGNLIEESSARRRSSGRPSARRSLSTGDAEDILDDGPASQRRVSVLKHQRGGVLGMTVDEAPLTESIERELKSLDDPKKKKSYELREHDVVYASSSTEDPISHMSQVGDVDGSKAWRTVRRPSDMNEYARQIKEYRAQEKPGKAHGRVFVKVQRIEKMSMPIPAHVTVFSCTLNNGIHFVTTPECRLTRNAKIEQEFELIEHGKLEFTLTLKVRRDPHIVQQFKALAPPARPPPTPIATPSHRSGMRSFFGGSPKKPKAPKHVRSQTEPILPFVMEENLARYLQQDGTLARAFVAFKDIAPRCDMRLFETAFPLIGQRLEAPGEGGGVGGTMVPKQIGEIVLQVFRLPPLPGIPQSELPQSLDECHRGLRHISWHKKTYHEGILTQLGGDCSTWRRRQLRVIGGNLVAFNDVTKRATATIDLKKAVAIEDDQNPSANTRRDVDDFDAMYGVERSFRLVFPHNQEITFFADTDEEKAKWLDVFRALVGHIPPHSLWAELLWQKQNELAKAVSSNTDGDRSRKRR
ncbi:hypothetical protein DFH11DRAFT_1854440 [Phellopilus nigrolimitatus]|nr:hypothetical protein DFH11DRAFT_1854440 [Phellopilus nigrolimitatus]